MLIIKENMLYISWPWVKDIVNNELTWGIELTIRSSRSSSGMCNIDNINDKGNIHNIIPNVAIGGVYWILCTHQSKLCINKYSRF